jgi:hypothetical protein
MRKTNPLHFFTFGLQRTVARLNGMSVLPSTADVVGPPRHVRVVPKTEVAALPRDFCSAPMNGHRETQ